MFIMYIVYIVCILRKLCILCRTGYTYKWLTFHPLFCNFLCWAAEMGISANYCTTTKRTVETSNPYFSLSVPTGTIGPFSVCDVYIVSMSVCV